MQFSFYEFKQYLRHKISHKNGMCEKYCIELARKNAGDKLGHVMMCFTISLICTRVQQRRFELTVKRDLIFLQVTFNPTNLFD